MKLNLLLNNPTGVLHTHFNIDPFANGKDLRVLGNVTDITTEDKQELCSDGEAEEINAHEIIEYFSPGQVDYILNIWCKKLKFGGILNISTVDFEEVARGIIFGHLSNAQQINELLHGPQKDQWDLKKTTFSVNIIIGMLEHRGLKVTRALNENFRCYVTAQRPNFVSL